MRRHITITEARGLLRTRVQLLDGGRTERGIATDLGAGTLRRVRRGWYVDADEWNRLWPESQHLLHVVAVDQSARGTVAFAGASAAVIHGLPLYRYRPRRVEIVVTSPRRHSAPDILRHERPAGIQVVEMQGMTATSPDATIADLAGRLSFPAAVAIADAGLRAVAVSRHQVDSSREDEWRQSLDGMLLVRKGAPGIRQARRVIAFADGRAELPGESVSRVHLNTLGVRVTDLQVPVAAPGGRYFYPDIELADINAFGEFDGQGKYLDEALRSGRTLEQVLLAEKRREDWIRGTTGRRMLRWGDREASSAANLGRHLASFGVAVRL